jgi:hypothetical protein
LRNIKILKLDSPFELTDLVGVIWTSILLDLLFFPIKTELTLIIINMDGITWQHFHWLCWCVDLFLMLDDELCIIPYYCILFGILMIITVLIMTFISDSVIRRWMRIREWKWLYCMYIHRLKNCYNKFITIANVISYYLLYN